MTSHPSPADSLGSRGTGGSRLRRRTNAPYTAAAGCREVEFCVRQRDGKGGAWRILPGQAGAGGGSRGSALAGLPSPRGRGARRDTRGCSCRAPPAAAGSAPGMPAWLGRGRALPSSSSSQGRPALPVSSGSGKFRSGSSGFGEPEPRPRGCENPPLVPPPRLYVYDFVSLSPAPDPSPVLPPPLPPVALGDRFNFLSPLGFFRTNQTNCDKMLVISGKTIKFLRLHLR